MTPEQHKQIHIELHKALDELFADYIQHHPEQLYFLKMPVADLLNWSSQQTQAPTEVGDERE